MNAVAPRYEESITVRRIDLEVGDHTPTFWFDDNQYLTALLNGLAITFPPGERFFIRSVQHFLKDIDDPELRERVRAFTGQEAMHTKEHLTFNRFLDGRGFPAKGIEDFVTERIGKISEESTPAANLARTAALEHFTAILGIALLEHPEVLERMDPAVAKLWAWHAIEEIEHRSVAFDVYKEAVDDEELRLRMMRITTVIFLFANIVRARILVKRSDRPFEPRRALDAAKTLFGKEGLLRGIVKRYRDYYRSDFHPAQHDASELLARAKARYLDEAA
jgi:predicted metal-dependent hydrolase